MSGASHPTKDERSCACVSFERRDCYCIRYNLSYEDREVDDGECECCCHDEREEREREEAEANAESDRSYYP